MANMSMWRVRAKAGMEVTVQLGHVNNTEKNRKLVLGMARAVNPELEFIEANWICNGWSSCLAELRQLDGKI